ncbi:YqgE/AlgH family protein [Aquicoccus sp. G2-2]|uniref:YqgE/AlgH family protein n=1 Tax=Aquicoccus sp. G2-2 TaxID=3092120 RepID=UPI002ADF4F68|nr:YqgE/AlgH family protein [Aquicoccus sp. G2-2]MEA1113885.1 YqgE/AlgH family protein [Aquicoccus sp. G2-2]
MTERHAPDEMDLSAKMLIAMPGMGDERFGHSVVYVCAHSAEGAMGLIVNKPLPGLELKDLVEQLEIGDGHCLRDVHVHFGGPVEPGRGFVLHSGDYRSDISTLEVDEHIGMTATLDILEALAAGEGPERALMALGYAGWGPGQLEAEILSNGWLTCEADDALLFGAPGGDKWSEALRAMGVDPITLSAAAGRA